MKFNPKPWAGQVVAGCLLASIACTARGQAQGPPPDVGLRCSASAANLAFGLYEPFNAVPTDMQGSIIIECSRFGGQRRITFTVGIGASGTSGTIQNRQLAQVGGASRLNYNIYREASRQSVWGDTPGINTVDHFAEANNRDTTTVVVTLFGRIFPLQNPVPGPYQDSLLVTIEY